MNGTEKLESIKAASKKVRDAKANYVGGGISHDDFIHTIACALGLLFDDGERIGIEKARQAVEGLQNPYPSDIFIEPTKEQYNKINALVQQAGLSVAGYNGAWGRKVRDLTTRDAVEAIGALTTEGVTTE